MDAALKAKWVEALRSGKYEQGRGNLVRKPAGKPEFCCLGVLCETQGTVWGDWGDDGVLDGVQVRDMGRSFLSPEILSRFGLTDAQQQALASMNDSGASFDSIATHIEAHL